MTETIPVTLEQQIACVAREFALRQSVYPKFVARGHMSQTKADYELRAIEAVLSTLKSIKENANAGS